MDSVEMFDDTNNHTKGGFIGRGKLQIREHTFKCVSVGLGLLCAVLLAANIAQIIYHATNNANYSSLRTEHGQLEENCNLLNISQIHLQTSYNSLQKEKNKLQTNHDALRMEKEQLQGTFTSMAETCLELGQKSQDIFRKMTLKIRNMACQSGWNKFDVSCYFVSAEMKNWTMSRLECIRKGADLVVINSRDEQAFVNALLKPDQNAWIGMTDSRKEGTWMWVDGTPVTTTFWQEGQPNSWNGGDQDCGEVVGRSSGVGEWNDEGCPAEQVFVCEH